MHAYLIVGSNPQEIQKRAANLVKKLEAKQFDFNLLKIADVRELNKITSLTQQENTAIVLQNIDEATLEAQNAFLKNLEEAPSNLIYILTAKFIDNLLPTIVSRCQVIEVESANIQVPKETIDKVRVFLNNSVGKRLAEISQIRARDEAVVFVQDSILGGHKLMLKNPEMVGFVESANKALYNLNSNGNVALQLTNFVVNI